MEESVTMKLSQIMGCEDNGSWIGVEEAAHFLSIYWERLLHIQVTQHTEVQLPFPAQEEEEWSDTGSDRTE
jgi:hypothetical protein